jgi:predicted unusual protein kinase regulating ubiquinone biosynthesis (AarF/ABC1/UbiB family)
LNGTSVAQAKEMALRERLSRYTDFARFAARYRRVGFVTDGDALEVRPPADAGDAEAFARDLEALGPTFIKLGQLLSTRADLLPPEYLAALARLQDNVDPFPYEQVERILQDEIGVRLSKAFERFDPSPIAAASLGQVHRAVLRGGRDVAVKVQRPNVRERVISDLEALDRVAALFDRFQVTRNVDATRVLDEFRRAILAELDYREEARNMVMLAQQLRDYERFVVPLPIDDFTTARVLTMDYIEGTKITAVSPLEWTEVDGKTLAEDLFRAICSRSWLTACSTRIRIRETCCSRRIIASRSSTSEWSAACQRAPRNSYSSCCSRYRKGAETMPRRSSSRSARSATTSMKDRYVGRSSSW